MKIKSYSMNRGISIRNYMCHKGEKRKERCRFQKKDGCQMSSGE